MNLFAASVAAAGDRLEVVVGSQRLPLAAGKHPELESFAGRDVVVGIRPQDASGSRSPRRRRTDRPGLGALVPATAVAAPVGVAPRRRAVAAEVVSAEAMAALVARERVVAGPERVVAPV
jgi:hypothetical protein